MYIAGRGRYAREAYPERSSAIGGLVLAAKITADGQQTIPNGSILTPALLPTVVFDTSTFTTTPNKLTVPAGAGGLYYVYAQMTLEPVSMVTPPPVQGLVEIIDDVSSVALAACERNIFQTGNPESLAVATVLQLTDGQVLRVSVAQATGSGATLAGAFDGFTYFGLFKL